jgi:glycosyltransferase involved in cell wall biosynthesis
MLDSKLPCSVIVPTYNRAELLRKTLHSLLVDTKTTTPFEVIVVDDGSSDHTFDIVKSYQRHGRIKYVFQQDEGYRVARARNLALAVAEGDICVFTDAGVVVCSQFVQAHLDVHHRRQSSVVIGRLLGIYSKSPEDLAWLEGCEADSVDAYVDGILASEKLGDPRQPCFDVCEGNMNELPMPWSLAWTANISMPRAEILAVGAFDENYTSWGVEDLDLALSLYRRDLDFTFAPSAVAIHLPHPEQADRVASNLANRQYLHRKFRMPETEIWLASPLWAHNHRLKSSAKPA